MWWRHITHTCLVACNDSGATFVESVTRGVLLCACLRLRLRVFEILALLYSKVAPIVLSSHFRPALISSTKVAPENTATHYFLHSHNTQHRPSKLSTGATFVESVTKVAPENTATHYFLHSHNTKHLSAPAACYLYIFVFFLFTYFGVINVPTSHLSVPTAWYLFGVNGFFFYMFLVFFYMFLRH